MTSIFCKLRNKLSDKVDKEVSQPVTYDAWQVTLAEVARVREFIEYELIIYGGQSDEVQTRR